MHSKLIAAALLTMVATAASGCGSDPSCETAMRHVAKLAPDGVPDDQVAGMIEACKKQHFSGSMRRCVTNAKTLQEAMACEDTGRPSGGGRRSEAEINLNAIGKAAKAEYNETTVFPQGTAPLTPATSCCEGPGKKCPVVVSDWNGVPAWDALGFEMIEPSFFQYSYASDGLNKFVAKAVGDLDCDGTTVTYELRGTVESGVPSVELIKPDRAD